MSTLSSDFIFTKSQLILMSWTMDCLQSTGIVNKLESVWIIESVYVIKSVSLSLAFVFSHILQFLLQSAKDAVW